MEGDYKFTSLAYRYLPVLFCKLGLSKLRFIANILGTLSWWCLPFRRGLAIMAIKKHLSVPSNEAKQLAKESFTENFLSFFESMLIPSFGFESSSLIMAQGDFLKKIQMLQKPIVATTAHLGAWELLAGLLGDFSTLNPSAVVVRSYKNIFIHELTTRLRSSRGAIVLGHRRATRSVLRILRKNGTVAFLVDHNTSQDEALFLPFLGELAAINMGPALLAVRSNALVLPLFLIRENSNYILWVDEPLDTCSLKGCNVEKIEIVARFYTEAVERAILRSPNQWFWMHNRWKTRPSSDNC